MCVLRSPCWVLQSVGSGLGRRLNVVAALMPILRTHNKRHPSREPATECNRVGSTLCRLTASLQGMLGNHEKDKNTLITTKAKLKVVNKEVEEVRWSHEVLQQKYNQVKSASTNPILRKSYTHVLYTRLVRSGKRSKRDSQQQFWRFSRRQDSSEAIS